MVQRARLTRLSITISNLKDCQSRYPLESYSVERETHFKGLEIFEQKLVKRIQHTVIKFRSYLSPENTARVKKARITERSFFSFFKKRLVEAKTLDSSKSEGLSRNLLVDNAINRFLQFLTKKDLSLEDSKIAKLISVTIEFSTGLKFRI